jgi:hypothetical protein
MGSRLLRVALQDGEELQMYRAGAFLLLVWGFAATAQAQPVTLTLACKGTTTFPADSSDPDAKQPISMGIIVNFTERTVQGFGFPGLLDYPVKITAANDVTIAFGGSSHAFPTSVASIMGSIDRVTGDVEATSMLSDPKTNKTISTTTYALLCRPTQRMF